MTGLDLPPDSILPRDHERRDVLRRRFQDELAGDIGNGQRASAPPQDNEGVPFEQAVLDAG